MRIDCKNQRRRASLEGMEVSLNSEMPSLLSRQSQNVKLKDEYWALLDDCDPEDPLPPDISLKTPSTFHVEGSSFQPGDLVWFEVKNPELRYEQEWGQARVESVLRGGEYYKLIGFSRGGMEVPNHPFLQEVPRRALMRMWDETTKPECPVSSLRVPSSTTGSECTLVQAKELHGPDLGYRGPKQMGLGPEMCGITLEQLQGIMDMEQFDEEMTMAGVVDSLIIPLTEGTGLCYALLQNKANPLRATHMVSHGWTENYCHFIQALVDADLPPFTAFWVCSMAIYQCEDKPELTIAKQLGDDVNCGPFATILKQAHVMLALLTPDSNIYTRMWCVLEIFVAVQLSVPVRLVSLRSEESAYGFAGIHDAAVQHGQQRCNSQAARCGDPTKAEMNADERAIRHLIEHTSDETGGYDVIDSVVEWVKAMYLVEKAEVLNTNHYSLFHTLSVSMGSHPLLLGGDLYYHEKAKHMSAIANAIHRIRNKDSLSGS